MAKKKSKAGKSSKKISRKKTNAKSSSVRGKKTARKSSFKKKTKKKPGRTAARKVKAKKVTGKKTTRKKASAGQVSRTASSAKKSKKTSRTRRKTHLKAKELREYFRLLLAKRAEILGDMDSMSRDALNIDAANLSHMPIHMADVGSDNYEQELTLGLVESERRLLQEINAAIERIQDGTYGVCEATGKPIPKARLEVKPWAKYTIEAAREAERNGGRRW